MNSINYLSTVVRQTIPLTPGKVVARFKGPRVLCNSCPKSGTHLLIRTLWLFNLTRVPRDYLGLTLSAEKMKFELSRIGKGQFQASHLYWDSKLVESLKSMNIKTLHIIRDPRDVVVSRMRSILNNKASTAEMVLRYLTRGKATRRNVAFNHLNSLKDDEERLMKVITGHPTIEEPFRYGIDKVIEAYIPWLDEKACCVVRFEDLVGPSGDGSKDIQVNEIRKIASYLEIDLSPADINYIAENVFSPTTTTFRKGIIGDWKNHFTQLHKEEFKARTGALLIRLGYETDLDW